MNIVQNIAKSYEYIIQERYPNANAIDVLSANIFLCCGILQRWVIANSEKNPRVLQSRKEAAVKILNGISSSALDEFINNLQINPITGKCEIR